MSVCSPELADEPTFIGTTMATGNSRSRVETIEILTQIQYLNDLVWVTIGANAEGFITTISELTPDVLKLNWQQGGQLPAVTSGLSFFSTLSSSGRGAKFSARVGRFAMQGAILQLHIPIPSDLEIIERRSENRFETPTIKPVRLFIVNRVGISRGYNLANISMRGLAVLDLDRNLDEEGERYRASTLELPNVRVLIDEILMTGKRLVSPVIGPSKPYMRVGFRFGNMSQATRIAIHSYVNMLKKRRNIELQGHRRN